jgi:P-type Cu2+ transporter
VPLNQSNSSGVPARQPSEQSDCAHCGLPVPAGLVRPGSSEQFCCTGCLVVYEAIRASGLERYYCIQEASAGQRAQARPTRRQYQEFDDIEFLDAQAPTLGNGLRAIEFFLEGVHCSACVWLVEKLPRVARGVVESRLDFGRALVKVVWEEDKIRLSQIAQTLDSLGYTPHVGRDAKSRELRRREERQLLIRIAVAGAGAGNVMLLAFALYGGSFHGMEQEYSALFRWMSLAIGLVVLLGPGSMFFRGAIAALRTRTAHLDLPIAIGLSAGTIAGTVNTILDRGEVYFDSLTGLVFLLLVGRYIQRRLERRAADSVERLFSLTPRFARIHDSETVREVPIEALAIDQIVEVRPGESFPADGCIVDGESSVDLSLLTGESRPVVARLGDKVFAGAVNVERPLLARVSELGRDTRVGKLLSLMEQCARRKAPIVKLADQVAGYFTISAIVLFIGTFVVWQFLDARHAIDYAVTLLIVSCPCGLGLATPFAVSVALGRAARGSLLVKGGEVLEKLSVARDQASSVFLDKTGTLTEPGLDVIEWHGEFDVEARLGPAIAALESKVSHPIARALSGRDAGQYEKYPRSDLLQLDAKLAKSSRDGIDGVVDGRRFSIGSEQFVKALLGIAANHSWATEAKRAMVARCLTPVWVAVDGGLVAVIGVGSRIRRDAAATIVALKARGMRVAMLSGDDVDTVAAVGRQLGLDAEDCHGGLAPEGKVRLVQEALTRGPVFMVGDGVNDAAALSMATVGIAVQGGAEASLTAADVYLGRAGVGVLIELLDGARRTIGVIRRCLVVSLGYNVVAAALAMTGSINAWIAALLMPLASFTVLGIALVSRTFEPTPQGASRHPPRIDTASLQVAAES